MVFLSISLSNGSLMLLAVVAFGGSVISLVASVFLSRRTDDVLDQRRQQRLWRSGPLGRRWLKSRRRLP